MPYVNNKDADLPAHARSRICAFDLHCLDSIIPLLAIAEIVFIQPVSYPTVLHQTMFVFSLSLVGWLFKIISLI